MTTSVTIVAASVEAQTGRPTTIHRDDEWRGHDRRQPSRNATAPQDITVGGFQGVELEWSVPSDLDFSTCDEDELVGDHPFKSWTAAAGTWAGERYHQGPGQVDRLWILDVDGERLVVDAWHMPAADHKDREALFEIMKSIRFDT